MTQKIVNKQLANKININKLITYRVILLVHFIENFNVIF